MQIFGDPDRGHIRLLPPFAKGCVRVELHNPSARNAMSAAMWQGLIDCFDQLSGSADTRVVVLAGGGRDFCSGADISEFADLRGAPEQTTQYNDRVQRAISAVARFPHPVIAEIRGVCMGAGLALAAMADLRLVAEDSRIAVPAARLGVAYDPAWIRRLVAVSSLEWVTEMIMAAREYSGAMAIARGLGGTAVSADDLADTVTALATRIAKGAPLTMQATKAALLATLTPSDAAWAKATDWARLCDQSEDYRAAVSAFEKGQQVVFKGK